MAQQLSQDDMQRLVALIEKVKAADGVCVSTGKALSDHEILVNISLGYQNETYCLAELGKQLGLKAGDLKNKALMYIASRPCYRAAWLWASREQGLGNEMFPPLPWESETMKDDAHPDIPAPTQEWDAGEMGCGELVMHLRLKMKELNAGQVMLLTAQDRGAPEDMPAWCRMTGHKLLKFNHPKYWIQRKDN